MGCCLPSLKTYQNYQNPVLFPSLVSLVPFKSHCPSGVSFDLPVSWGKMVPNMELEYGGFSEKHW